MVGGRCSVWAGLRIGVGGRGDYEGLRGFHYRGGWPAVVMRVFAARYGGRGARTVGVIVEARPVLNCALRGVALRGRYGGDRRRAALRLNREMRTIARVVVHPQFRGIGLGVGLVRHLLERAETPYVEALAAMGRVHPLFERAGMRAWWPEDVARPVYYVWGESLNRQVVESSRRDVVKS